MERFNSFDGDLDELSKPDLFAYEVNIVIMHPIFHVPGTKYLM